AHGNRPRMRGYRFVGRVGEAVAEAGTVVAESAHVESDHQGGLAAESPTTPSERVAFEFLRQTARTLGGEELGAVRVVAKAVGPLSSTGATDSVAGQVGIVSTLSLPEITRTGGLVTIVRTTERDVTSPEDRNASLQGTVRDRLERTPATYVLLVDEDQVRVFPGPAVATLAEGIPPAELSEHLYSMAPRRFAELAVEGFIGDPELGESGESDPDESDPAETLRTWATDHDLRGALYLGIFHEPEGEPASLQDFA
ncbi:MAG: hypothetical protein ABEJ27_01840, partial [Halodesulfurarchaeum sp.]